MKKFIVLILFMVFTFSGCSSYSVISKKFNKPIVVDGKLNDWNGKLRYFKDEKMAVGVSNDSENLYICLSTANQSNITKMLHMGFTIWLEPGNEKDETIGIQYPIKEEMTEHRRIVESAGNSFGRQRFEKIIKKIKLNKSEYLLINDDNFPLGAYSLTDRNGVKIGLGYDAGKLVYEMKIPERAGKYFPINLTLLKDKTLTLKFSTGKPEKPFGNKVARSPQTGMGERAGGMRRGGGRRSANRQHERSSGLVKPIDFEVKVTLAQ